MRKSVVQGVMGLVIFVGWVDAQAQYRFNQIWGYLMKGEETRLTRAAPITDIGYFSAQVNTIGRIDGSIARPKLAAKPGIRQRVHLVISAPASPTLIYFCLSKSPRTRAGLISDIIRVSQPFDGVQIDFESMRAQEKAAYISFLAELKRMLPAGKMLSVAVPARTELKQDAFSYAGIATVVDKVLVMAYDEHWRTGAPGPIASAQWCRQVCSFARRNIPAHKLIMGLPLYGRIWQKDKVARALKYPETLALWEKQKPLVKRLPGDTPYFEYATRVTAAVYFEDVRSLTNKLSLYQRAGIQQVGFWRIGQGPAKLWNELAVDN